MKTAVGLIAGVLLLGLYYIEYAEEHQELPAEYTQGPEARSWLRKNNSESALASNRFGETQNAQRFVQQLYSAGAKRVIVPLGTIQDDGEEVYADSLLVTLPEDPAARRRVWTLCVRELERMGESPTGEPDDDRVLLWWD
ncbi:MAG: hypothetical protein AB7O59_21540 [Pirellulales bacterium]